MAAGTDQGIKLLREILGKLSNGASTILSDSESHIGSVGGDVKIVRIDPLDLAASDLAYAIGDQIGNRVVITDAMRVTNGTGYLMSVVVEILANITPLLDIVIYSSDPTNTAFGDNAPIDIHDNDIPKILGKVSIAAADYCQFADNVIAVKTGINLPVEASGSKNLYANVIARSVYGAGENEVLALKFGFERN